MKQCMQLSLHKQVLTLKYVFKKRFTVNLFIIKDEDCFETVKRNGHLEMDVKVKMNAGKVKAVKSV